MPCEQALFRGRHGKLSRLPQVSLEADPPSLHFVNKKRRSDMAGKLRKLDKLIDAVADRLNELLGSLEPQPRPIPIPVRNDEPRRY